MLWKIFTAFLVGNVIMWGLALVLSLLVLVGETLSEHDLDLVFPIFFISALATFIAYLAIY